MPVLRSAMRSPGFAAAHPALRNLDVFTEGPENSRPLAVTPLWGKVEALLERGCNRVLRGAATAASLGGQTSADIDQLLRAGV